MIVLDNKKIITNKNKKKRTIYLYKCDACGKDRGYFVMDNKKISQLCKRCGYKKRTNNKVNENNMLHKKWSYKRNGSRCKLYKAQCTACSKDRGYVPKSRINKECPECSIKNNLGLFKKDSTPWNKDKKLGTEYSIQNSCAQQGIRREDFDGFLTPENSLTRGIFKKSGLSQECFKAADYICSYCGIRGGILNAHHLNNFCDHEQERLDLNNLVCLCEDCHKKFHGQYGHKTIKEDFYNFLSKKEK